MKAKKIQKAAEEVGERGTCTHEVTHPQNLLCESGGTARCKSQTSPSSFLRARRAAGGCGARAASRTAPHPRALERVADGGGRGG